MIGEKNKAKRQEEEGSQVKINPEIKANKYYNIRSTKFEFSAHNG